MEVVRLKFQWNWTTPGVFIWKIWREQFCKNQLFKVTNTGKTFSNVFISLQLTKNDVKSLLIKITSKKVSKNNVQISTIEITLVKVRGKNVDFSTIEIPSKKVSGNIVDFSTINITSKKYAEMTCKFVEIWSSMYRRNTTSNRRKFDGIRARWVCP